MQNKSYEEVAAEILTVAMDNFPASFQQQENSSSDEVAQKIADAYKIIFKAVMNSRRSND